MDNMKIYNGHRAVPQEALKPINAGRLKGMSDINPMFRIKSLTEDFGVCGIGWYYTVDKQWIEPCGNESVAFVNISLYIKVDGEWSKPIFGTGGSKIISMERSGAYVSDEAFKMATTDAISVACKQLGYAADVYWSKDRTKYNLHDNADAQSEQNQSYQNSNPQKSASNPQKSSSNPQNDAVANQQMIDSVDRNLIPEANAKVTQAQLDTIKSEMQRTGINMHTILTFAKAKSLEEINQATAVAIINNFARTPNAGERK